MKLQLSICYGYNASQKIITLFLKWRNIITYVLFLKLKGGVYAAPRYCRPRPGRLGPIGKFFLVSLNSVLFALQANK